MKFIEKKKSKKYSILLTELLFQRFTPFYIQAGTAVTLRK